MSSRDTRPFIALIKVTKLFLSHTHSLSHPLSLSLSLSLSAGICVSVCVCVCECRCCESDLCEFVCLSLCEWVCVSMYDVCVCVCLCMCACVFFFVHVCVCVCFYSMFSDACVRIKKPENSPCRIGLITSLRGSNSHSNQLNI